MFRLLERLFFKSFEKDSIIKASYFAIIISLDANLTSKPLPVDQQLQNNQVIHFEIGTKEGRRISAKHL